jgi:seryl-tRNA synthetase
LAKPKGKFNIQDYIDRVNTLNEVMEKAEDRAEKLPKEIEELKQKLDKEKNQEEKDKLKKELQDMEKSLEQIPNYILSLKNNITIIFNGTQLGVKSQRKDGDKVHYTFWWLGARKKFKQHKEDFKDIFALLIHLVYGEYVIINDLTIAGNKRIKIWIKDEEKIKNQNE